MRKEQSPILNAATIVFLLSLTTATVFAADTILIGGLTRHGIAGQVISVPIVIKDNALTPAGADQNNTITIQSKDCPSPTCLTTTLSEDHIRSISFLAGFDTDSKVNACADGTGPLLANCNFIEAGIAPTVNTVPGSDPCGALDGKPDTPCYFRFMSATTPASAQGTSIGLVASYAVRTSGGTIDTGLLTNQAAPRGDLVGYLKIKLSPTFPAGGTVTISLDKIGPLPDSKHFDAEAYLSGYDLYTTTGNPATDETVANANLTLSNYQPADADNSGTITTADLTKVSTDLQSVPGSNVTGTNFRDDCDGDGKITGADVLCVYNELNPNANSGLQHQLLDIDLDGNVDALTDGVLLIRSLAGLTGTALTNGTVAAGAHRTDPTAIANYIAAIAPSIDVDGAQGTDALTDGLMITRAEAGLTGTTVTNNAIAAGATRTSPQIEAYIGVLQQMLP